jgi:hypothetical protein
MVEVFEPTTAWDAVRLPTGSGLYNLGMDSIENTTDRIEKTTSTIVYPPLHSNGSLLAFMS